MLEFLFFIGKLLAYVLAGGLVIYWAARLVFHALYVTRKHHQKDYHGPTRK